MLTIRCNGNFCSEREYIYNLIFGNFWAVDYQIKYEERKDVIIQSDTGTKLYIADTFLQMPAGQWLKGESLPIQPLQKLTVPVYYAKCVTDSVLPIIYGEIKGNLFSVDSKYCYLDIFGSALFMLTRYEEVVRKERDALDRFSAMDSLAYQEGFLERPIINEYLEILWQWLKRHFPELKRKERHFAIIPTHDVDYPFWSLSTDWYHRGRMLAGDLLKRRNIALVKEHLGYIANAVSGNFATDPNNTFDMIMDISEEHDLTSHFYFMTAQGRDVKDGNYDIMHPEIRKLARKMMSRGHKVGIHPGFGSYQTGGMIKDDVDKFRQMLIRENLPVEQFGGRQHYLHWAAPITWQYYEEAGIIYDTSLSYADHIGFRCGICYDYPVYNVVTHTRYNLREYPLLVMECSGLDKQYMNLSYDEMLFRCQALKEKVRKYEGIFVILWHNTSFMMAEDVECYKEILG